MYRSRSAGWWCQYDTTARGVLIFVLILALLILHLPMQSPSMIVSGRPTYYFCFFLLVSPSRKLWLFAVSLRAVEYTETVGGGFPAHRFRVPCITLDTLDTLESGYITRLGVHLLARARNIAAQPSGYAQKSSDSQDMGTAGLTTRHKWPANPPSHPMMSYMGSMHRSFCIHPFAARVPR